MSRAALYAFSATSLTLAAACGGSTSSPGGDDASADANDDQVQAHPAYGIAVPPVDASSDASPDEGVTPAYGLSGDAEPPFDGPIQEDGGIGDGAAPHYGAPPGDAEPEDAPSGDDGGGIAAYGISPS